MINIGDKYVIEIGGYYFSEISGGYDTCHEVNEEMLEAPARLFRVKGFKSLVLDGYGLELLEKLDADYVNEYFGELQDESYKQGLHDAWEAAKKLFSDLPDCALDAIFTKEWRENGFRGLMDMEPEYALEKIREYEKKVKRGEQCKD